VVERIKQPKRKKTEPEEAITVAVSNRTYGHMSKYDPEKCPKAARFLAIRGAIQCSSIQLMTLALLDQGFSPGWQPTPAKRGPC
jgi:hypothetical protein